MIRQPKGVMGVIAPWNFPVECALVMVNDIIGAGNRAVVKASELAPATSALLERIIAADFDPAELAVVNGGVGLSGAFRGPSVGSPDLYRRRARPRYHGGCGSQPDPLARTRRQEPDPVHRNRRRCGTCRAPFYFRIFKGGQVYLARLW